MWRTRRCGELVAVANRTSHYTVTHSFSFPILGKSLGPTATFGIFVAINILALIFVYKFVPETRGRTLEELEDDFRTHDAAHFVHEAPAAVRRRRRSGQSAVAPEARPGDG